MTPHTAPPLGELGNTIARAIAEGIVAGGRALMSTGAQEVLSVDEAATFLGLDRNTIYEACGRSEIPHRRVGKRILLSRTQLVTWLGACKAAPVGSG